jgi:hypothetical protein
VVQGFELIDERAGWGSVERLHGHSKSPGLVRGVRSARWRPRQRSWVRNVGHG